MEWAKVEMAMRWGGSEGWGLRPRPAWFCLTPFPPASPCKILFLVNLPTTITTISNKTCFVNKNILEITNKLIPSIQSNF